MQTEIVINAEKAINNVRALQTAFEAVSKLDFSNVSKAFNELEKASSSYATNVQKTGETVQKNVNAEKVAADEELTLLQKRAAKIKEIENLYNQADMSKLTQTQKEQLQGLQNEFQQIIRRIADMKAAMGDLTGANKAFENAFVALQNIGGDKGLAGGIANLKKEYTEFLNLRNKVQQEMKNLQDQSLMSTKEKPIEDKFKNLLENLKDRIRSRTAKSDGGGGITYTEKELADDKIKLDRIVRAYNEAMEQINSAKRKVSSNGVLDGVDLFSNIKKPNNAQSTESKIERLVEMLRAEEVKIKQRTLNDPLFKNIGYTDSSIVTAENKVQRLINKLRELGEEGNKAANTMQKLTLDKLQNPAANNLNYKTQYQKDQEKADNKSQLYLEGTTSLLNQIKALDGYKRNIKEITTLLNQLNTIEKQLKAHSGDNGLVYKEKEYKKLSITIKNLIQDIAKLAGTENYAVQLPKIKVESELSRKVQAIEALKQKLDTHKGEFGDLISESAYQKSINKFNRLLAKIKELDGTGEAFKKYKQELDNLYNRSEMKIKTTTTKSQAEKEAEAELKRINSIYREVMRIQNLENKALAHSGAGGKFYTAEQLQIDKNNLQIYLATLERFTAAKGESVSQYLTYNPNMFNNVNVGKQPTTLFTELNGRINSARENAARLYNEFQKTKSVTDKIAFKNAVKELSQLEKQATKLNSALKESNNYAVKLFEQIRHQASWMVNQNIAGTFLQLPSELFDNYRELEQAMAGVKQVMPAIENSTKLMSDNMEEYTKRTERANQESRELINMAHEFARSSQEVVEAATLWGRGYGKKENMNGLSQQEKLDFAHNNGVMYRESTNSFVASTQAETKSINKKFEALEDEEKALRAVATTNELVRQSAMLATVDNFSMEESVKGLEAILASYDMRARSAVEATLFAGRAVDIVSKVAHNGQISAQDLVRGIEATGKAAQQAGISLSFLSAMIETGVRNTGRSGSEIGQAVKALTVGIHSKKAEKELKEFGVSLTEVGENGKLQMRSVQSVILDVAEALEKGDRNAEKMLMGIAGGRYQYSKISAILKDRGELIRMWGLATSSAGFAQEQLDIQMNTINSKIKQVQASLQDMTQSQLSGGLGDVIKTLLVNVDKLIQKFGSFSGVLGHLPQIAGLYALYKILPRITSSLISTTTALKAYKNVAKTEGLASAGFFSAMTTATKEKFKNSYIGADNRESVAKERNAKANQDETRATDANTVSKNRNTAAENVNTGATNRNAGSHEFNAVAETTETAAARGLTAATASLTVAETACTFGLNILIGALVYFVYEMFTAEDTTKEFVKNLNEVDTVTRANADSVKEHVDKLQQEISSYKDQKAWMEYGIRMNKELREEINDTTKSEKEREKAVRDLEDVYSAWNTMMETYTEDTEVSFDRINTAMQNSDEVMKNQMQTYEEVHNKKIKKLAKIRKEQIAHYKKEVQIFDKKATLYKNDLDAFDKWGELQLDGLNIIQKGWVKFFSFLSAGFRSVANAYKSAKEWLQADAATHTGILSPLASIEKFAAGQMNDREWFWGGAADFMKVVGAESPIANLKEYYYENSRNRDKAKEDLLNAQANAINEDIGAMNPDDGEYVPPEEKGKKDGAGKKETLDESSTIENQAIHNMTLQRKELGEAGFDFFMLKNLASRLASMGINGKGMFKLTDEQASQYGIDDVEDTMSNAYVMANLYADLLNAKGSSLQAIIDLYHLDEKQAAELLDGIADDSEADREKYKLSGAYKNYMFGGSLNGRTFDSSKIDDGINKWIDVSMENARLGCVEFVTKAGAEFSSFLKEELDKGVLGVDTLVADAGDMYEAYNGGPIRKGDIIVGAHHVGISDGEGGNWDNSSSSYGENGNLAGHAMHREFPDDILGVIRLSNSGPMWKVDGREKAENLLSYRLSRKDIERGYQEDERKREEKRYSIQESEAKRLENSGDKVTASAIRTALEHSKIDGLLRNQEIQTNFAKSIFNRMNTIVANNKAIQNWLKKEGVQWSDLSIEQQEQVVTLLKNQKDNDAETLEKIMKSAKTFAFDKNGKSTLLEEGYSKIADERATQRKQYGYRNADQEHDFQLKKLKTEYNEKRRKISLRGRDEDFWQINLLNQEEAIQRLNLLKERQIVLENRLNKSKEEDNRLIEEEEKNINKLVDIQNTLVKAKEDGKNVDDELKQVNEDLAHSRELLATIRENGSEATQEAINNLNNIKEAIDEAEQSQKEAIDEMKKIQADFIGDALDDAIIKGNDLRDVFKNIAKDLASYALKRIVYNAFGVSSDPGMSGNVKSVMSFIHGGASSGGNNVSVNTPVTENNIYQAGFDNLSRQLGNANNLIGQSNNAMSTLATVTQLGVSATQAQTLVSQEQVVQQEMNSIKQEVDTLALNANTQATIANTTTKSVSNTSSGATGLFSWALPNLFANGGSLAKFANGGDTGLIKGAGNGTSDSILTYLANKGKFIATSNGEYIVKADSVNKLGVGFLDMLNNNPDLLGFADGGNLGAEYVPTMSANANMSYKKYTKGKTDEKNPNRRLEQLMQEQTDTIRNGSGSDGKGGSLVVLNTQADSTSVLKALKDNPRAVQKILGTQQKHGFK